jgi:hypothetical protein
VVTTLVRSVTIDVSRRRRAESRARSLRLQLGEVLADAESLADDAATDAPSPHAVRALRSAAAELRAEAGRLGEPAVDVRRRPWTLEAVCAQAIATVGVPPVGTADARLEAWTIESDEPGLGELRFASRKIRDVAENLLKGLIDEAMGHGAGILFTRLGRSSDGRVRVTVANDVDPDALEGFAFGSAWLDRQRRALPGTEIDREGQLERDGTVLYVVSVIFGHEVFAPGGSATCR